jgi:hypothetical protein
LENKGNKIYSYSFLNSTVGRITLPEKGEEKVFQVTVALSGVKDMNRQCPS